MTEQETITISKEKYDEMMEYINEGSVPIEENTQAIREHTRTLEQYKNELIEHGKTKRKYTEDLAYLSNRLEQDVKNDERKVNNILNGFSKYLDKIKFGVDDNFEIVVTVNFQLKDDINFGEAIVEVIDIIELYAVK
ncbi:hypothetical protein [Pseudomonas sp.]|uniref:hypothetical protein n=1 Tax=Pseudomonas sp. TaxID=306 RepID=UPI00258E4AA6|nr:hypothetical protein [Pseudomonas sp.]